LSSQPFQNIQVAIKQICTICIDKGKASTSMHTEPGANGSRLADRGRVFSATAGAGHHSIVSLIRVWTRLLLRNDCTLGHAGGRSESCQQKRKHARNRGAKDHDLNPHTVSFHSGPGLLFREAAMDATQVSRVGCLGGCNWRARNLFRRLGRLNLVNKKERNTLPKELPRAQ
jgi:hypothetical protein